MTEVTTEAEHKDKIFKMYSRLTLDQQFLFRFLALPTDKRKTFIKVCKPLMENEE